MNSTPHPAQTGDPYIDSEPSKTPNPPTEREDKNVEALEGRYELHELISQGGMGTVYRARHRQLDRPVAIKFMRADLRGDPEMRRRFTTEAKVASSLEHPHIVSVNDFGVDAERGYFLVMELLNGQTLRSRMIDQPLRARIACDVIEQVAWALRYIHSRDIVHCDLKPENIFLTQSEEETRRRNHVKLIDFGLAFRPSGQPAKVSGTPPYLAPERLRGAPPSPQADLYSLGVLFFELLTGRTPYAGTNSETMDPPPPPSTLTSEPLEARTDEIVLRALARRPEDRPPSIESFLFELRTLMSMMGMRVRRVNRLSAHASVESGAPRVELRGAPANSKRAHECVPLVIPARLRRDGELVGEGLTLNLSEGGVFVSLSSPPPLGAELEVEVPLAQDHAAAVVGRAIVRWRRLPTELHAGPIGCGLEWVEPSDALRRSVARAIDLALTP